MSTLVQLTNGDWINPRAVVAIRKLEIRFCPHTDTLHEPRYIVDMEEGASVIIRCADAEEVEKQVRELAEKINHCKHAKVPT